jgi:hypothetical protein
MVLGEGRHTFCGIRSLVIFGEPLQVLILNPRHPVLILAVVEVAGLLPVSLVVGVVLVCHNVGVVCNVVCGGRYLRLEVVLFTSIVFVKNARVFTYPHLYS